TSPAGGYCMAAGGARQAGGRAAAASWRALGTSVPLLVTEPRALGPARCLLGADLAALDAACSRFRADSEIVALDHAPQDGGGRTRPVRVSPLLAGALAVALRAARRTGGGGESPGGGAPQPAAPPPALSPLSPPPP